jgi:hypothetical protein
MAFRERGHNAFSCDLKPCSGGHVDSIQHPNIYFKNNIRALFPDIPVNKTTL